MVLSTGVLSNVSIYDIVRSESMYNIVKTLKTLKSKDLKCSLYPYWLQCACDFLKSSRKLGVYKTWSKVIFLSQELSYLEISVPLVLNCSLWKKTILFHQISFLQDKREIEASLTLGLTMRGIQIFQVGKCRISVKRYWPCLTFRACLCGPAQVQWPISSGHFLFV
jgi:hypothetical protein